MDFGRFKYEQEQSKKAARKNTTNVVVKEMKFRPKIDGHDYATKMSHVRRFLEEGSKVKLTIMFRGREMAHPEFGRELLNRVATDLEDVAMIFQNPTQDGRNMTMILHPTVKPKKSTESKQLARGEKKHKNFSTLDRIEGVEQEVKPEKEELTEKEKVKASKSKYKKGVQEELDGISFDDEPNE